MLNPCNMAYTWQARSQATAIPACLCRILDCTYIYPVTVREELDWEEGEVRVTWQPLALPLDWELSEYSPDDWFNWAVTIVPEYHPECPPCLTVISDVCWKAACLVECPTVPDDQAGQFPCPKFPPNTQTTQTFNQPLPGPVVSFSRYLKGGIQLYSLHEN